MNRRIALLIAATVAVMLAACDPLGPLAVFTDEQRLESIVLTPDSTDLKVGDSVKVAIQLVGKGGGTITTGSPVITLGNPLVISTNASGWVKGLRVGRSEVLATLAGKRGSSVVRVIP